jgi:hypothetical protein
MLSAVDEGILNVTTALQAASALDNTLIVFTAVSFCSTLLSAYVSGMLVAM